MAAAVRSEDQFLCPICLQLFNNPVTTPCGHNFCRACLTQHWDTSAPCRCPLCKELYHLRPALKVNTLLSEMVYSFKQETESRSELVSGPEEVSCDVCTDPKLKAVKSCLVCLTSYCETHLQPHLTVSRLKRHQLTEPVDNLEERMCSEHDKPLELFCETDHSCVCVMCTFLEHHSHTFVSLKEEYQRRKASLEQTQGEIKRSVVQRQLKIQQIQRLVQISQKAADREAAAGLQLFTALMESVQRRADEFIEELQEKQRQTKIQAQDLIQELEQEISELKKTHIEVEQLSRSEDHLLFIQRSTSVKPLPDLKDWSTVSIHPASFEGCAARALSELDKSFTKEHDKVFKAELRRVQQFDVDITLDPDSAHSDLVLSEDLKQVHHSGVKKALPNTLQRFAFFPSVLGKQSFSLGKFYFEVQVKGKTFWDLGVAQVSIERNRYFSWYPENGVWSIGLINRKQYRAYTEPPVPLLLNSAPQKVGVYVDCEAGVVSFHDVDTAHLIYCFTNCCFKEKLFPFLNPGLNDGGENAAPLTLTVVKK